VIYSRRQCHLCDVVKDTVEELRRRLAFDVEVRDVDEDADWLDAYGDEVPVGFIGERKVFKYRVDVDQLERALLSDR
jgi:glutaredoxin